MPGNRQKIVCFNHAGLGYSNNTKCPDSDSCCQTAEQCRSDRLCNSNDDSSVLVRALCANRPWTYDSCATICAYDTDTGLLPRVQLCSDGSYCCDNQPACCRLGNGIFLDDHGAIVGRANATTTSTSPTTTTTKPTASNPADQHSSSTPTPTPTRTPTIEKDTSGLSESGKIGVGVGVSLGVITIILLTILWFLWRRREKRRAYLSQLAYEPPVHASSPMPPSEVEAKPISPKEPAELPE